MLGISTADARLILSAAKVPTTVKTRENGIMSDQGNETEVDVAAKASEWDGWVRDWHVWQRRWRMGNRLAMWLAFSAFLLAAGAAGLSWFLAPSLIPPVPARPSFFPSLTAKLGIVILLLGLVFTIVRASVKPMVLGIFLSLGLQLGPSILERHHGMGPFSSVSTVQSGLPSETRRMAVLAEHHRLPKADYAAFRQAVRDLATQPDRVSASRFYFLNRLAFGRAYYPRAIRYRTDLKVLSLLVQDGFLLGGFLLLVGLSIFWFRFSVYRNLKEAAQIRFSLKHVHLPW